MRTRLQQALGATTAMAMLAMVGAIPTDASALTLTVNSVVGNWTDTTPNAGVSGVGTNQIKWGTPVTTGGQQSSYVFNGIAPPPVAGLSVGTPFSIGTFTHNNFPISASGVVLTAAELTVNSNITVFDGMTSIGTFNLVSVFDFDHDETPNGANPCAYPAGPNQNGCADRVQFSLNNGASTSFEVDGTEYVLNLTGFEVGGSTVSQFLTAENLSNTAELVANVVDRTTVVPLPAALPMFLAALSGLGLISRRKA